MTQQTEKKPEPTPDQQLDALTGAAADLDTTPEKKAAEITESAEQEQGAQAAANITIGVLAQLIEMAAPVATLDDRTKKTAVEKLTPLFEKYGIGLGGSSRWATEIDAAIFFGVTGFTCWQKIQAEQAAQLEQGANSGDKREHQPSQ
jgi:hypothetical protein